MALTSDYTLFVIQIKLSHCPLESYLDDTSCKLPLLGNKFAVIDRDDFDKIKDHTWFVQQSKATAYVITKKRVNGKVKTVRLHRLIANCPDGMETHHVNFNPMDNRKLNLDNMTPKDHRHLHTENKQHT